MEIFLYVFAVFILMLPFIFKRLHVLDIMPLFLFYFDASLIYSEHVPSYQYFENFLIVLVSLKVILVEQKGKKVQNFGIIFFLVVTAILFPILQGENTEQLLRNFSFVYGSLILLPVSFIHYSKSGNFYRLFKSGFILLFLYVLFVFYASTINLGGLDSERFGGDIFYFGYLAMRGGITYIAFVLLLAPIIYIFLKGWEKIVLIVSIIAIIIIFFTVLKRFVFVIIGLGILSYLIRGEIKGRYKFVIGALFPIAVFLILSQLNLSSIIESRYYQRGGESKFSSESIESDIRIVEPVYVFINSMERPLLNVLIGEKGEPVMTLRHGEEIYEDRKIHNSYALLISRAGIIGLLLYLAVYYKFYSRVKKAYNSLKEKKKSVLPYWIVFQNLFFIFILQGMVGGHDHISLRGIVFLYIGAIGGYINFMYYKSRRAVNV